MTALRGCTSLTLPVGRAQIRIVEIGSGSGGTSVVVMAALAPYADSVEFLYTDISPALVGYGHKTYGDTYPFARFQLLDVDRDVESQGCEAGTYDIVFATNVLHATTHMGRTISNCKVMLRRGAARYKCDTQLRLE